MRPVRSNRKTLALRKIRNGWNNGATDNTTMATSNQWRTRYRQRFPLTSTNRTVRSIANAAQITQFSIRAVSVTEPLARTSTNSSGTLASAIASNGISVARTHASWPSSITAVSDLISVIATVEQVQTIPTGHP